MKRIKLTDAQRGALDIALMSVDLSELARVRLAWSCLDRSEFVYSEDDAQEIKAELLGLSAPSMPQWGHSAIRRLLVEIGLTSAEAVTLCGFTMRIPATRTIRNVGQREILEDGHVVATLRAEDVWAWLRRKGFNV